MATTPAVYLGEVLRCIDCAIDLQKRIVNNGYDDWKVEDTAMTKAKQEYEAAKEAYEAAKVSTKKSKIVYSQRRECLDKLKDMRDYFQDQASEFKAVSEGKDVETRPAKRMKQTPLEAASVKTPAAPVTMISATDPDYVPGVSNE